MIKTRLLNQLFYEFKEKDELKEKFIENGFYADGIINEEEYNASPAGKKLLFIAKEPNAKNHETNVDRSFVTEWNNTVPNYQFACRIAEWAYGVLNDFPVFENDEKMKIAYLKKVGFMNIKKSGGIGFTEASSIIEKTARDQLEFITREIEIIDPDIIILSLSQNEKIRQVLFPGVEWISSGYTCKIARLKNKKIIDFYHPSSRNVAAATYSLLQNIMKGKAFKKL